MKIGDEVYIHGYIDEIRSDVVIIRNEGGYFGTVPSEVSCSEKPNSCEPQTDLCKRCHFKGWSDWCETCKHKDDGWDSEACDPCSKANSNYEPKDESQNHSGGVTEMVETMPCEECGHWEHGAGDHYYCALLEMGQECYFESKNESTLMFANEPKTEQLTCDGNCWMKKQNGEWLCEHCQREPKTEREDE